MLRVTLELIPFGDETRTRKIGHLDIFSKGAVVGDLHKYGVIEIDAEDESQNGMFTDRLLHKRQPKGAWLLVLQALELLAGGRMK